MNETAKRKMERQAAGERYGCFVELAEDETPDHCVKDIGDKDGCIYASRHKTREGCRYWLPVTTDRGSVRP